MKSPAIQYTDEQARLMTEEFIREFAHGGQDGKKIRLPNPTDTSSRLPSMNCLVTNNIVDQAFTPPSYLWEDKGLRHIETAPKQATGG